MIDGSPFSAKQLSDNCYKLADIMKRIPQKNHHQGFWVNEYAKSDVLERIADNPDNECGTVCCALGWAATSRQFEGMPTPYTINRNRTGWGNIGIKFFGQRVWEAVFINGEMNSDYSVKHVVELLEKWAAYYCELAKKGE